MERPTIRRDVSEMAMMTVHFERCIQDSKDAGSDDQHMVSRIFFEIHYNGRRRTGLYADIKQVVGGDYDVDPLEVSRPIGYDGPLNYGAFRDAAEQYYRTLIGPEGRVLHSTGAGKIRFRDNIIIKPHICELPVPDPDR